MTEKKKAAKGEKEEFKITFIDSIKTTADIHIPQDPLQRVIGQDEAVNLAYVAAKQRRHFLLVGPPGTGKSMIAQALSLHLQPPTQEVRIVHNPENPERPFVEVKAKGEVLKERETKEFAEGEIIDPKEAPINVAEKLGYKCMSCGEYSAASERFCPKCGEVKIIGPKQTNNPFSDIFGGLIEVTVGQLGRKNERVTTTRKRFGKEEVVAFERAGNMIKVLDQKALEKRREFEKVDPRKVLVPLERTPVVLATGASETELLGDVKHDPYGGHPQLGVPPFERVVPGSVHEAHQGVLFIDELPHLGHLQRYILTAMQEKRFPITARNPQSSGASVKVNSVPCDFIFVGACNIQDLHSILSPLRSRIIGAGYEVLVETTMEDNEINRAKMAQFMAQEIIMDGKIPHASKDAVYAIIEEGRRRAKKIEGKSHALSLRLREMGGLIRAAGDLAVLDEAKNIESKHIKKALQRSKTIEEQIKDRHGSYFAGLSTDISSSQRETNPYHYWNKYPYDDKRGYE
ncbi:MAG: AAA family ATPase [Methanomassiliicoccales archaeon]|nr:MAG: AAA family ATPase [Methanomassiliicoccales archaeon]